MRNDFKSLGVLPPILQALKEMGFESPTEVQNKAIPHILNHEDVIVMSKTGSGKTAVFGVPLLQMIDPKAPGPQGLILTPTRELAVQVDSDLKRMARHLSHKTTSVYGQHNMQAELQTLKNGVSIVTGTPGRVYDHISHGNLKTKHIRFLVLDEADRMLDIGFFDQVMQIVKTVPRNRLTLMFSATIPRELRRICVDYMKHPLTIEIKSHTKTVDTTIQEYYRVDEREKQINLNRLLLHELPESCLVFCNQRHTVEAVQRFLDRKGYASRALHGDIPQVKRLKTVQQFKKGYFHVLVATDVAARGLHIDDLSLVINYDLPLQKDSYIHRIGRTGRAGNGGRAVTLVTGDQIMSLYEIEEHIGSLIEEAEFPSEEDLSEEHKAEIKEWLQSNAHKRQMMQGASGVNTKISSRKNPSFEPRQHREQRPGNTNNRNTHHNSGKRINKPPNTQSAKPVKAPVKAIPEPPRPPASEVAHSEAGPETAKIQAVTPKKTFLQRLLPGLFDRNG
ncbi:MAG: DEAD/DEAH box helicase [Syntrophomonadaceae bacterium]|nr:DEAD/DEAH box helicase [Syntrophomonadaceae bacterium]